MRQLPILRDYQHPCVDQTVYFFNSNKIQKPKIVVAPTAAGKSIIIAAAAARLTEKVLVIQPSVELLKQNYRKYLLYDDNVGAYSASVNRRELAKVTFATIMTIAKVPHLFADFKFMIIDECHLYSPKTEGVFGKFIKENPQLKILGMTASPFRLQTYRNSSRLQMMHNNNIYNGYQHICQIQDIAPKFWAKIDYYFDRGDTGVLEVNSTGADYTDRSLELYGQSVEAKMDDAIRKAWEVPTLIFVPSVKLAEKMARQYPGSGFVSSKTPEKERDQVINDFKSGRIKRVFNYGILGVGFDFPELMVIIDAVPTMSLAKHYQKYGRLTRVHPLGLHVRKSFVDFAQNTLRFGYMEDLEIRRVGTTYHFFSGEKQITGVNLNDLNLWQEKAPAVGLELFEDMEIRFGKFQGKRISEIPEWWLSWASDNLRDEKLLKNVKLFIKRLDEQKRAKTMSGRWV